MQRRGRNGESRVYFTSSRCFAVPRGLITSHLIYSLSLVMFDSFFVANTTTRDDYADSESLHPSLITRNPKALLMRI